MCRSCQYVTSVVTVLLLRDRCRVSRVSQITLFWLQQHVAATPPSPLPPHPHPEGCRLAWTTKVNNVEFRVFDPLEALINV